MWAWLDRLRQDVAYATRTLVRARGFAAVVILTLALGIGAAGTMFSVVNAVLLNPLPFPNADRLVVIWEKFAREPDRPPFFDTYHDFENWENGSRSFEQIAAATWKDGGQILNGAGPAREVFAMPVGIEFFSLLGVAPELGRTFQPADLNQSCTVVLKHSFWMQTFGGQKDVVGRRIELSQNACTIAGVMPARFAFYPDAAAMWRLITPTSAIARDPKAAVGVFALLKPGVSIQRAQAEVEALYQNAPGHDLGNTQVTPVVYPLAEQFSYLTGPSLRLSVVVLFGAVSFVLLIGCLNVANLLLGRAVSRHKEMALRAALGSGRARLVRQLLTEALLLSGAGAALGTLLASAAVHYFRTLNPIAMPPGNPVAVNMPVLCFIAALAVATAIVFGLLPALTASRVDLIDTLRASAHAASPNRTSRTLRRGLVVAEVALSLALLTGAGLLIQSVAHLAAAPLGFQADPVITMSMTLPQWSYSTNDKRARFYRAVLDRAALVPSVASAAFASSLPPDGRFGGNALAVDGRPEPSLTPAAFDAAQVSISPAYFQVMGVPLKRGREFESEDREESAPVAIVNEALARKYFPNDNPIGKRINVLRGPGTGQPWLTIVGVVANEKDQNFFRPMSWEETPTVFRPLDQDPHARFLTLRTLTGGRAMAEMQKQIASLDNGVPIGEIQTMDDRLSRALTYPRLRATILTVFAGFAVLLAAIGLYAVLSQLIAQRTQEFGVRMALGAQGSDLLRLVIREGMALTLAGLVTGLIIAASLTRLLGSFLYGVKATDPLTFAGVAMLLLLVAFLAVYIPARRASRVDPMVVLRYE
jgi:putative ABC transport system permease protein